MKFTPENITSLEPNQIIIIGTNTRGIHAAGAAKFAHKNFGLTWGKTGYVNQSYGINTKDKNIRTLPLPEIQEEIKKMLEVIRQYPDKEWLATKFGCGLAGLLISEVAPLFLDFLPLPTNLVVPVEFYNYWKANTDKEIYLK